MQFTRFCRDFDLVAKYAFSQAPSCTNFLPPGSASDSRTGHMGALQQGKNLKMWKIGKMKKMGYLCQTSSKYEFNTPDIVKLYSGPVLLSSIFDFWQSFPSEIFFLVFAQILLKNLVKYALFGQ